MYDNTTIADPLRIISGINYSNLTGVVILFTGQTLRAQHDYNTCPTDNEGK